MSPLSSHVMPQRAISRHRAASWRDTIVLNAREDRKGAGVEPFSGSSLTQGAYILNESATAGVPLALGHFGTGYSSLMRILELPFNVIKVDQASSGRRLMGAAQVSWRVCLCLGVRENIRSAQAVGDKDRFGANAGR